MEAAADCCITAHHTRTHTYSAKQKLKIVFFRSSVTVRRVRCVYLLLTRLGSGLAHNELLLDEGLGVDWLVTFLLSTVLSHVLIGAPEELG